MSEKPHYSHTQIDMFCKCPEAWRRRYIEGERIPPGIAMLKGTGFHAGAQENFQQKIESHVDLPPNQIVDAAVAACMTGFASEVSLTKEEASRGLRAVAANAIDDLVDLVDCHAHQQAPDYQPIMVEQRVRIELDGPRDLLAVIDLGDDEDRVTDFKTSRKRKTQNDADNTTQLTIYDTAFRVATGRPATELRLDTIVQTKTTTKRYLLSTQRGPRDFGALAQRINAMHAAIEAGTFHPASGLGWWCSPKWCGYHSTCKYVNPEPYLVQLETD